MSYRLPLYLGGADHQPVIAKIKLNPITKVQVSSNVVLDAPLPYNDQRDPKKHNPNNNGGNTHGKWSLTDKATQTVYSGDMDTKDDSSSYFVLYHDKERNCCILTPASYLTLVKSNIVPRFSTLESVEAYQKEQRNKKPIIVNNDDDNNEFDLKRIAADIRIQHSLDKKKGSKKNKSGEYQRTLDDDEYQHFDDDEGVENADMQDIEYQMDDFIEKKKKVKKAIVNKPKKVNDNDDNNSDIDEEANNYRGGTMTFKNNNSDSSDDDIDDNNTKDGHNNNDYDEQKQQQLLLQQQQSITASKKRKTMSNTYVMRQIIEITQDDILKAFEYRYNENRIKYRSIYDVRLTSRDLLRIMQNLGLTEQRDNLNDDERDHIKNIVKPLCITKDKQLQLKPGKADLLQTIM